MEFDVKFMSIIINAAPTNGLILYYSFDENTGSTVFDYSGNKNHGNITDGNNLNWVDGILGKALNIRSFGGVSTKVTFPPMVLSNIHTVSMWIYPSLAPVSANYGTLFSQGTTLGIWYRGGLNKITFVFGGQDHLSNTVIVPNTWNHIVITCNAGNVTFYLNGNSDGTATSGTGYNVNNIGNDPGNETYRGYLDELRVYNRVLSSAEIQTLYKSGSSKIIYSKPTPITILNPPNRNGLIAHYSFDENSGDTAHDSSGNNLHGQLINNPSWVDGIKGKAIYFNTASSAVSVSGIITNTALTISCWIYLYSFGGGGTGRILDNGKLQMFTEAGKLGFDNNAVTDIYSANSSISLNIWIHACVTRATSSQNIIWYINGQTSGSGGDAGAVANGTTNLFIGNRSDLARKLDGKIDDLRIFNRALSAAEVWSLYSSL